MEIRQMTNNSINTLAVAAPPYVTRAPNESVRLYDGILLIATGGQNVQLNGEIVFEWLPSPSVCINAREEGGIKGQWAFCAFGDAQCELSTPKSACPAPIHVISLDSDLVTAHLNGPLEAGDGTTLSSAVLHAVNLGNYRCYSRALAANRAIILQNDEWYIEVDAVDNSNELEKLIKKTGGHAITHWIRVRRSDHTTFTSRQLSDLQTLLYYFLTFIEGRIVNAILPVGFDADNKVVWQQWGPWRTRSWKNVMSWVDPQHGEALTMSFAGFARKWRESHWQDAMRIAIQGYAHANRNDADLETGIILAVMCLDTIAWQNLVLQNRMLTEEGFKRLTTADRIRLLCTLCKIPLLFHPRTPELEKIAKLQNWKDIAQAVVEVRNNVVHPDNKLKKKTVNLQAAIVEAWTCAMWMTELVILYSIDYLGPYSDRQTMPKWAGTIDKLPWDTEASSTNEI
jgi:hypothetical protein